MCTIHFGSGSDFLILHVHGRTTPTAQDYWGANWLHCTIELSVRAFRAKSEWQLRNEDLARFLRGLEDLTSRPGEALLETGDGWLDLRLIRDNDGRIEAECQLADKPEDGNAAEFRLRLGESSLSNLVKQIRDVVQQFPVVGKMSGGSVA